MPIRSQDLETNGSHHVAGGGYTDFKDVEIGTYFRGIVSHVEDPVTFYLQFDNPDKEKFYCLQQELQQELNASKKETAVKPSTLSEGQCYATQRDGSWCRVLVESFTSDGICKVFYLDEGFRQSLHAKYLKYIASRFLISPPQAVLCRLYGIDPNIKHINNGKKPLPFFRSLINQHVTVFIEKVYAGQVGRFLEGESVLFVTAYMNNEHISFNTQLMQAGYTGSVEHHEQTWHYEVLSSFRTTTLLDTSMDSVSTISESCVSTDNSFCTSISHYASAKPSSHWIVTVSHIVNPGRFFIQFQHTKTKLEELCELLANPRTALPRADVVKKNYIYAVRVDSGHPWHRGKCLGRCGFVARKGEVESCYDFFLIDYGSVEKIQSSCIRQLPARLLEFPSFAVECSLGLEPPKGGWPTFRIEHFQALAYHSQLQMTVNDAVKSVLIVDLAQTPSSNNEDVQSFKMALKEPQNSRVSFPTSQYYHKWINHANGTRIVGRVLRVSHPCAFYVRFEDLSKDTFPAFQSELEEELDVLNAKSKLSVCTPCPGTAYAIRYNGSWHRILLEEISPVNGDARIFFVDNGLRVAVAPSHLRRLPERFMEYPAQAIRCKLCNVKPLRADDWPETSRQYFRKETNDAVVTVYVVSALPGCVGKTGVRELTYIVFLYVGDQETSANSLLVENGHAESMGPLEEPSQEL